VGELTLLNKNDLAVTFQELFFKYSYNNFLHSHVEAIVTTLLTINEVSFGSAPAGSVGPKIIEILASSPSKDDDEDDVDPMDALEAGGKGGESSTSAEKKDASQGDEPEPEPSEQTSSANDSDELVLTDKDLELFDPLLVHVRPCQRFRKDDVCVEKFTRVNLCGFVLVFRSL
jgi:hypothetical protein